MGRLPTISSARCRVITVIVRAFSTAVELSVARQRHSLAFGWGPA
jgi:hypothetical protein